MLGADTSEACSAASGASNRAASCASDRAVISVRLCFICPSILLKAHRHAEVDPSKSNFSSHHGKLDRNTFGKAWLTGKHAIKGTCPSASRNRQASSAAIAHCNGCTAASSETAAVVFKKLSSSHRNSRGPARAQENGFYDQSAFCRQFQKRVGLTPRQYRARLGKSAKWKPSPQ